MIASPYRSGILQLPTEVSIRIYIGHLIRLKAPPPLIELPRTQALSSREERKGEYFCTSEYNKSFVEVTVQCSTNW